MRDGLTCPSVYFLIAVEIFSSEIQKQYKTEHDSIFLFRCLNLFSSRFSLCICCSCASAGMNCPFLITYNLYQMSLYTRLLIVPSDTWESLATLLTYVSVFASIIFCTRCTNCDVFILFEYGK